MSKAMKGIKVTLKNLERSLDNSVRSKTMASVLLLKREMVLNTPIDTGNARELWKLSETKQGFVLSNDAEYIEQLNNGSSTQAPAFFVEATAIKYGKPVGSVIDIDRN